LLALTVRREWARQNPEVVHDYLRELLLAQRAVLADPQLLSDGIVKYLAEEPAQARELADAYLKAKIWDANGGLSTQSVEYTLQFLRDGGLLSAGSRPEDVADVSYLNSVLDELGRK